MAAGGGQSRPPGRAIQWVITRGGERSAAPGCLVAERVSGVLHAAEEFGGAGVVGTAEFVVAGLDDRRELAAEVQRVAGPSATGGSVDHGVGRGDHLLARLFGGVAGADDGAVAHRLLLVTVQVFMGA